MLFCRKYIVLSCMPAIISIACANVSEWSDTVDTDVITLAGHWDFQTDPAAVGVKEKWFLRPPAASISLPGSMAENALGDDVSLDTKWTGGINDPQWFKDRRYEKYTSPENFRFPFWLQPVKYYVGPAWYQKQIDIPRNWQDKNITLLLERCHWQTTVWLDDNLIGTQNSLSVPHRYNLGPVRAGPHKITICVDNTLRINVGPDAHSVSDHTQSNWNGIVGQIQLIAEEPVCIEDIQVYPDIEKKSVRVKTTIINRTGKVQGSSLFIRAESFNSDRLDSPPALMLDLVIPVSGKTVETNYVIGDGLLLWDEFSPALYRMSVTVKADKYSDEKTATFGFREFAVEGTQFTINGRKTFLRGTLECCIFPLTGYPFTDRGQWERIIKTAKAFGLNHIRFHSWCPPKAAFDAADKLGFYFQVEGPFWTTVGNGGAVDEYILAECDRILTEYGNHPSFCLMAYGNEPGGDNQRKFFADIIRHWKNKDTRHLYTSASGWPIIGESDYHSTPAPRIAQWGSVMKNRINVRPGETFTDYRDTVQKYSSPVVSHEMGQWCVYPDFDEIKKYTGVLRAKNFEIFRDLLGQNHMLSQAHDFLMASGKLQTLCYKEDIESALRTPGFGGFQLLDLHDFPGQGTALVGVLNAFWEPKGYVTASEYSRFCNCTVPLARMKKRTFTNDETFRAEIEIAHFGAAPLKEAVVKWMLTDAAGKTVKTGAFQPKTIPVDNCIKIGDIEILLAEFKKASGLNLEVSIDNTAFANDWDIWVYPAKTDTKIPYEILVTSSLDKKALSVLSAGGRVLLLPPADAVKGDDYGTIPAAFSPVFWNTAWTRRQPPHTLGILCDPKHPALKEFPTEYHSNWQWWDMVTKSGVMILNDLPEDLRPIVQVIDDWFTARRLGLVFEAKVNGGSLVVCSIDLQTDIQNRPVARQFLLSLLGYMQSGAFKPACSIEPESVEKLFKTQPMPQSAGN